MDENATSSLAPVSASCFEPRELTPSLFGGNISTTPFPLKPGLNAPFSGTKAKSRPQSLSDKLTPSLITAGLVRGITPRSIRKKCGAVILDGASFEPDGGNAA